MQSREPHDEREVILDAVRRAIALHKAIGPNVPKEAQYVIPILAAQLPDSDDLKLAAEQLSLNPSLFGRRVRDLAVELARRVSLSLTGIDPFAM